MQAETAIALSLKPLSVHHTKPLLTLIQNNRQLLGKYLYWVSSVVDFPSCKRYISDRINSGLAGAQWFVIQWQGKPAGVFGIKEIRGNTAEVGYWLAEEFHGQGMISQAISLARQRLASSQVTQLEFRCLAGNKASIAVAKRAGGKHIDTVPGYFAIDNRLQDLLVFRAAL